MKEDKYVGFREVIKMARVESAVVNDAKSIVDNMLGEEDNKIDDVPDSMLEEYFDIKFGGDEKKAILYWLS